MGSGQDSVPGVLLRQALVSAPQPCTQLWPLSDPIPTRGKSSLTTIVLLTTGPGQQGEETLHSRLSWDRKVSSSACNLCRCLPSQQPLGTGQDCFWSQGTGQDGGGLCELVPFLRTSSLRASTHCPVQPWQPALGGSPDSVSRLSSPHCGTPVGGFHVFFRPFLHTECKWTSLDRKEVGGPLSQPSLLLGGSEWTLHS